MSMHWKRKEVSPMDWEILTEMRAKEQKKKIKK